MTALPLASVVDASVGIKLILEEAYSSEVRQYVGRLSDTPPVTIHVPDLFFVECANVLWKNVRRGDITLADSRHGLHLLNALLLPTTPAAQLNERAIEIACQFGISAYDALYVSLSEQLGLPLLTADNRLVALLAGSPYQLITLDSITPATSNN